MKTVLNRDEPYIYLHSQVFTNSADLRAVDLHRTDTPLSVCSMYGTDVTTDDYMMCSIRNRIYTLYHPMSTCRMGRSEKENSVVDFRLRSVLIWHIANIYFHNAESTE